MCLLLSWVSCCGLIVIMHYNTSPKCWRHLTVKFQSSHSTNQTFQCENVLLCFVILRCDVNLRLSDPPCSNPNPKPAEQQPGVAGEFCVSMWQWYCTQYTKYQNHNVYQQQALKGAEMTNVYLQPLVYTSTFSVINVTLIATSLVLWEGIPYAIAGSGSNTHCVYTEQQTMHIKWIRDMQYTAYIIY